MPPDDANIYKELLRRHPSLRIWLLAFVCSIFLLVSFYFMCLGAPRNIATNKDVQIASNSSLNQIAQSLKRDETIRSPFWFKLIFISFYGEKNVMAGEYLFEKPVSVFRVASRLAGGNFGFALVRLTFREGITMAKIGDILQTNLVNFPVARYKELAKQKEGYLFPDTYFFLQNATPEQVIVAFDSNFKSKLRLIDGDVKSFGKPLKDVVIMASIIEAEARTTESRRIISGILWKRLALGLPLQVDAPFEYIIGKNTFQLTAEDLKFKSPYNTYLHKGLPPTAIGNPGLDSLKSTVMPVKSPYLFYLSDVRGNMHYARTFEEHVANKNKYLR